MINSANFLFGALRPQNVSNLQKARLNSTIFSFELFLPGFVEHFPILPSAHIPLQSLAAKK